MYLCVNCSRIPFRDLFGASRKPRSWTIGSFSHAVKNQTDCSFCEFLVSCHGLYRNVRPAQPSTNLHNPQLKFEALPPIGGPYDLEEPWFERAGLEISGPTAPALWLSFKGERAVSSIPGASICVSCQPHQRPQTPGAGVELALAPRQRQEHEITYPRVNYGIIHSWLQKCTLEHTGLCKSPTKFKRRILNLRLIDVHRREVVFDSHDTPYLALSYVWGASHRNDLAEFWQGVPSSASITLPERLPQTVEDAINFTRNFGHRFLWVDAFCINQQDQVEMKSQIAQMHLVYECAFLTLAAVDGESAESGLCGISRDFQNYWQPQTKIPYGSFMATYVQDVWSLYDNPQPWETRAWTLQEMLLSRRILFFNEKYMTFMCQYESYTDILRLPDPCPLRFKQSFKYFWENGFNVNLYGNDWSFLIYDCFLANFTRRSLTDPSDVLLACGGALNQITRNTGVGFFNGLPRADMHMGLLWKSHHESVLTRRVNFPSWTWAGWIGRTEHHYCLDNFAIYHTHGDHKRNTWRRKKNKRVTFEQQNIVTDTEAFIADNDDQILRIASTFAAVTVQKVRERGDRMKGIRKTSEHPQKAVGNQWVLRDNQGKPLSNDVGEVARFEPVDYSFQVNDEVSKSLDMSQGSCELAFVKYFPYLMDTKMKGQNEWLFDYVGCLVLVRQPNEAGSELMERIGCAFLRLEDWIGLEPKTEVRSVA